MSYQSGLCRLPKKPIKATPPGPALDTSDSEEPPHDIEITEEPRDHDIDSDAEEYRKARAILHANIGACYVKLVCYLLPLALQSFNLISREIISKL